MKDRSSVWSGLAVLAAVAAAMAGRAASASDTAARPEAVAPVYRPSLSDLMTATIEPRHAKLWFAGRAGNWPYAAYELHNLRGAFARMAAAVPRHHGMPMKDMLESFVKSPAADLAAAIRAEDPRRFATAYGALTEGCNECHRANGRALVRITVPDAAATPFPDQGFAPARP